MTDLPLRSPLLMSADNTALLVIDVQEKLVPAIQGNQRVIWNIGRLIRGAQLLGLPVLASEQYPQGLGRTTEGLGRLLNEVAEKRMFSCRECSGLFEELRSQSICNILATGIESHVCVQQSALDLMSDGFNVFIPVDAIGSRFQIDHENALLRMQQSGVTTTTTESALFEWCETSTHPQFKAISRLVRESLTETT